jgi:hypothetical protein
MATCTAAAIGMVAAALGDGIYCVAFGFAALAFWCRVWFGASR